jgi:hypothetical protein
MEEQKLNFSRNEDPTIVKDPGGKILKEVTKIYNNLKLNLGFCHDQLKEGKLTEGMKETHLSLSEHYVIDFLKALGYEGKLQKEADKRHAEIRSLNETNRELRRQLGDKVSNEDVRERLKNISEGFKKWWNIYGFGHVSEISFTNYGYLSLMLSGMIAEAYYDENKELSEEDKTTYLKGLGFQINNDKHISADECNLPILKKLLKDKYPSVKMHDVKLWVDSNALREINILITDLNDL